MVDGGRTLQLLYDQRSQVVPLVVGLRQYVQTLSSLIRIDVGDGTLMAAVKGLLGTQVCDALPCAGGAAAPPAAVPPPALPPIDVPIVDDVTDGLDDLLEKVLLG
jgi:hypothetical protein